MKIAIVGYGAQGQSALAYWSQAGNDITVCDQNQSIEMPAGVRTKLGPDHLKDLGGFDLIVRSPIVHPRDIIAANPNATNLLHKITTNTNVFFGVCPTKNIIGVTGTKGKGTTSTLIAKMLEAMGKKVHLGGNIGTPPLELLKNDIQPDDWVVLELANFQLIDLKQSPHVAVCLMVTPEHLDWHSDLEEYLQAKQQLFVHQQPEDTAIYYGLSDYSQHVASVSPGNKIPYMKHPGADVIENNVVVDGQVICSIDDIKLLGKHNWQNVCAAVTAVWQIEQNPEAIAKVISSFTGLEHRLEFVREVSGIKYYDDSFGTTPETAQVALQAFQVPKIAILGGSSKGADFNILATTVASSNVRTVVLIGEEAPKIQQALHNVGFDNVIDGGKTMSEIVDHARQAAKAGDVILLSTACASFDLFKNYKDRGEQFKAAVEALS